MKITANDFDNALKRNGMTRTEFATKLGIDRTAVNMWVFRGSVPKKFTREVSLLLNQDGINQTQEAVVLVKCTVREYLDYEALASTEGLTLSQFAAKALTQYIAQRKSNTYTKNHQPLPTLYPKNESKSHGNTA